MGQTTYVKPSGLRLTPDAVRRARVTMPQVARRKPRAGNVLSVTPPSGTRIPAAADGRNRTAEVDPTVENLHTLNGMLSAASRWRIFIVDTMKTRIQKWGNSLAVRIPVAFARSLGLEHDSQVELSMTRSRLVVAPVRKPKPQLRELLDRITPANVHREADAGKPQGREAW